MKQPSCEVVRTRSGALAMLDRESGEVMHPIGGPLEEADRLYVAASRLERRLREPKREPLVLLDVGLGAGSNVAAALRLHDSLAGELRPLRIVSIDRSRAAFELALSPEHAPAFGWVGPAAFAAQCLARHGAYTSERIEWRLRERDFLLALAQEPADSVDIAFWDPFSPDANPESWTLTAFQALRRVCRAGASVHTYSGATRIRSALLLAGFHVGIGEKIAEGKYATTAAIPPGSLQTPLDQRWLDRLTRSSAPFPSDAPANALEQIKRLPQFT